MAMTNITEDGKQATIEQLFCSTVFAGKMQHQLKIFSALNIFLSITAFLGNALILVALHKESSLHPPSKLLFRCLATTDLCVGLITEPLAVSYWMSVVNEQWNICRYTIASALITGYTLCAVSLLTLTAISVDRLLALLLGLRYRHVVTLKRTNVIVKAFWVVSAVAAAMSLWNYLITLCYSYVVITVCLVISIFSYTKIFVSLHHHQTQVENQIHQEQPSQTSPLNIARYKKAVSSALWVQLTLVVCYLPFVIVGIVGQVLSDPGDQFASFSFSKTCTITILYLNSSLNPILYCWNIKEVKRAVKDTIRQILCCSST
ncbi:melanocyte-stimulating hormone receptor-like [Oculina patagonica]